MAVTTLKVKKAQPLDVAHFDELEGPDVISPGPETPQVVELAGHVVGHRLIPAGLVRLPALGG